MRTKIRIASSCRSVMGTNRLEYIDSVWEMYQLTYAAIGTHLSNKRDLLKYDSWEICFGKGERPVQFSLWTKTPFGLKAGLLGFDGSSEGKIFQVGGLKTKFKQPGYFGEVSHRVKDIVLSTGAPVVCSSQVGKVIGKSIVPVSDIEYERSLEGVGRIKKVLVGKPKGISTTDASHPSCPLPEIGRQAAISGDDGCDFDAHLSCLMFDI